MPERIWPEPQYPDAPSPCPSCGAVITTKGFAGVCRGCAAEERELHNEAIARATQRLKELERG